MTRTNNVFNLKTHHINVVFKRPIRKLHTGSCELSDISLDLDAATGDAIAQVVVHHGVLGHGRVLGCKAVQVVVQALVQVPLDDGAEQGRGRLVGQEQLHTPCMDNVYRQAARVTDAIDHPSTTPGTQKHLEKKKNYVSPEVASRKGGGAVSYTHLTLPTMAVV